MSIEVIEAKRHHCGIMVRRMRKLHGEAVERLGANAHRELVATFERSSFRKAVLRDGELVAMGGVIGAALAPEGYVWLALADDFANRHSITATREAARWLKRIMETRTALTAICLLNDAPSKRFAEFLGFRFEREVGHDCAALIYRRQGWLS